MRRHEATASELVARARSERAARANRGDRLAAAATVRALLLGCAARRHSRALLRADVSLKLQQVAAVSAVLAARGAPRFLPPAAALVSLGSRVALLASLCGPPPSPGDGALLAAVCALVVRSIRDDAVAAGARVSDAPCARTLLPRLSRACVRIVDDAASLHAPAVRGTALDLLAAASGCTPSSSSSPPPPHPEIVDAAPARCARAALAELHFGSRVARRVCMRVAVDEALAGIAASEADRALAGRVVGLALALAAAPPRTSPGLAYEAAAALLPLPLLHQRIAADSAAHPLADPNAWVALAAAVAPYAAPPARAAQWLATLGQQATVGQDGDVGASSATAGQRRVAGRGGAGASVGSRRALPLPDDPRLTVWPPAAFLLGNIVLALSSPAAAGGTLTAALPPAALTPLVQLLGAAVAALPDTLWGAATPVLWVAETPPPSVRTAAAAATPAARMIPIPSPPLLTAALRRLGGDRLVLDLAAACLGTGGPPPSALLRHARLRLPASDDEEAATYDHAVLADLVLPAEWAGAMHAATTRRRLAAPPLLAVSLLCGAWRSSAAAATALFSWAARRRDGGGATQSTGASPPAAAMAAFVPPSAPAPSAAGRPTGAVVGAATLWPSAHAAAAFCRVYALLAAPRETPGARGGGDGDRAVVARHHVLNALAFTPSLALLSRLWAFLHEESGAAAILPPAGGGGALDASFFASADGWPSRADAAHPVWAALALFAAVLGHAALVLDDEELYGTGDGGRGVGGLPLRELRHAIRALRDVLLRAEGVGVDAGALGTAATAAYAAPPAPLWRRFASSAGGALRLLYDRHCVRPLGPQSLWSVDLAAVALAPAAGSGAAPPPAPQPATDAQRRLVAAGLAFAVPFTARARAYDVVRVAARAEAHAGPPFRVRVTRGARLFETAYAALAPLRGPALRRRVAVVFTNEAGAEESGIDAGGLFKELWTALADTAFDPAYGLFRATPPAAGGELYPNPASSVCSGLPDELAFEFVGRLVGKALFEGITLGPRFAPFLLARLAARPVALYHLPSLDPDLARSLRFVSGCDDDATLRELCLSFVLPADATDVGGADAELVPGGADIAVTASNRHAFVARAADHALTRRTARQTDALLRGVHEVLPPAWLAPFSPPELQVLISGSGAALDVAAWRAASAYTGGYGATSKAIADFWAVVGELPPRDASALLRFVTACPRAPPLGFAQLDPPFTIQRVELRGGQLPSASTCFHTLRLPPYAARSMMREKLLQAIHAGAGFELT